MGSQRLGYEPLFLVHSNVTVPLISSVVKRLVFVSISLVTFGERIVGLLCFFTL